MEHSEFKIGELFFMSGFIWKCTDIGTRVICAHKMGHPEDESWYKGPPYAVGEFVIDEYDMEACTRNVD